MRWQFGDCHLSWEGTVRDGDRTLRWVLVDNAECGDGGLDAAFMNKYAHRLIRGFIVAALIFCAAGVALGQVNVRKIDYEGWSGCYEISNPLVRLVVVPQIGGRVMEYSLNGEDAFWQNYTELGKTTGDDVGKTWRNYGGYKAWNAPQSEWSDYFYDSLPAGVEALPDGRGVRITTAPVKHLGYQFIRDIVLSDSTTRVRLVERMRNISDKEIEWGVWGVAQVKVPCWIIFPLNPKSAFANGWNVLYPVGGAIEQVQVVNGLGILKYDNKVENFATDAKAGWMVYFKDQLAFVKRWASRIVGSTYPDGGCDAAFYTCGTNMAGGYAEMEVMGPIVKLKPGEENELVQDWFLSRVDKSVTDTSDVMASLKSLQARGMLPRGLKLQ